MFHHDTNFDTNAPNGPKTTLTTRRSPYICAKSFPDICFVMVLAADPRPCLAIWPLIFDFPEADAGLGPADYIPTSATRSCAKTYLGNLCRRDYLGKPHITCISTCDTDFCNCNRRSPPPEMFPNGETLFESPEKSTYYTKDVRSCVAAQEAESKHEEGRRAQNRERDRKRRFRARSLQRRNEADRKRHLVPLLVMATMGYM